MFYRPRTTQTQATCRCSIDLGGRSDEEIASHLLGGCHDALTFFFEKYSGMVFSIARRMLKDDGEAEEAVQQVFLDMYRALDQFDPSKAPFKTWLLQYAYHRAINRKHHLEAKGFYAFEEFRDELLPPDGDLDPCDRSHFSSPEVVHLIEQLLAGIQPRQRRTIELAFFEGLTAEEIAEQTGETAVVVRHNLYRGLAKLRAALVQQPEAVKKKAVANIRRAFCAEP